MATQGYLVIADITGYTAFLSEAELEHARDTLQQLLEVIIGQTKPPLIISRLAGDAVISYGIDGRFMEGQTFMEKIEETYVAFRRTMELMMLNNTCRCNACSNVKNLDLKFFVHYGEFAIQHFPTYDELIGNDVNTIHRLLKNSVSEETGLKAYLLISEAAVQALGLGEMTETMTAHRESYEHIGDVAVWVADMHPVWERAQEAARYTGSIEKLLMEHEIEIAAPPEVVWDYLAAPEFRSIMTRSDSQEIIDRSSGRLTEGSTYVCYHGDQVITQLVTRWQPFEWMAFETIAPMPGPQLVAVAEIQLIPTITGTRVMHRFGTRGGSGLTRLIMSVMSKRGRKPTEEAFARFGAQVEADLGERGGLPDAQAQINAEAIAAAAREQLATLPSG